MAATELTKADFQSDQETRWCPGCGDYAVLAAVQSFFPELGIPPERVVFVSGIGCAGRFAYYMDTYGMHGIHGRGPALATGLAAARDDLSIWVVTGDGDALSIGGNHLIHALRRNVPVKILLFNNQIYGLTKGQASPTSELGKVTKSTPFGSIDGPFNPVSLALGAEATFVARTIDTDKQHLPMVLRAAAAHEGAALVEIYQNCPVFNDGAFDALRDKKQGAVNRIHLEHGRADPLGVECGGVRDATARCGSAAATSARPRWSSTTRIATTRRSRSRCRGCPRRRTGRRRSGSSATSRGRCAGQRLTQRAGRRARAGADDASLDALCAPGTRGRSPSAAAARSGRSTRRTCCRRGWRRWTSRSRRRCATRCVRAVELGDLGYIGNVDGADRRRSRASWRAASAGTVEARRRARGRRDGRLQGAAAGPHGARRRRDHQPAGYPPYFNDIPHVGRRVVEVPLLDDFGRSTSTGWTARSGRARRRCCCASRTTRPGACHDARRARGGGRAWRRRTARSWSPTRSTRR